ncbi:tyrosine-type recombinase/integrase [Alteromonas mediterranea]|uniref:tyrosine-type recombinase/integrase n=1 Tax=Alteromonas mediterranea TaxID=314275 RepID=UPI0003556F71|nr:integrase family protein [Alteromonas mediterranea U8]
MLLKNHTIRPKIVSVRYFIGVSELPDPRRQSKLFAEYTNHKINQKPSRQSQAVPMRLENIDAINAKLDTDSLIGLRDAVIFNTAIDTIFRASNLLAIDLVHIDFNKQRIFAPRSKTDKSGKGQYGYISKTTIELIDKWLTYGIVDGPLLRKLSQNKRCKISLCNTLTVFRAKKLDVRFTS